MPSDQGGMLSSAGHRRPTPRSPSSSTLECSTVRRQTVSVPGLRMLFNPDTPPDCGSDGEREPRKRWYQRNCPRDAGNDGSQCGDRDRAAAPRQSWGSLGRDVDDWMWIEARGAHVFRIGIRA